MKLSTPVLSQVPGMVDWIARARLDLPERGAPLRMTTRPMRDASLEAI
jgi:hypothetical protein